ncbi:MAG: twin-arginine translocase TatA/TatE family subunit [Rickettsiaceae bacterium H1]|nr:twin-arginine translocase TatA/TatE family subunit [Rickettsiaceae bacterium H1]
MSLGPWQVFLIFVIILILFGAGKLPQVMGDLGKGIRSLKKGLRDIDNDEPNT